MCVARRVLVITADTKKSALRLTHTAQDNTCTHPSVSTNRALVPRHVTQNLLQTSNHNTGATFFALCDQRRGARVVWALGAQFSSLLAQFLRSDRVLK